MLLDVFAFLGVGSVALGVDLVAGVLIGSLGVELAIMVGCVVFLDVLVEGWMETNAFLASHAALIIEAQLSFYACMMAMILLGFVRGLDGEMIGAGLFLCVGVAIAAWILMGIFGFLVGSGSFSTAPHIQNMLASMHATRDTLGARYHALAYGSTAWIGAGINFAFVLFVPGIVVWMVERGTKS